MDKFIDKMPSTRSQGKPQRPVKEPHLKEPTLPSTPHLSPTDSETEERPPQALLQATPISRQASERAREV
ncbi:Hypothetical predicted protein [Pelobates cultripes]|uniref:Uncharacterized protein n=1 Tax=Pelobates cultripes TaxID=61616 RepID=A0AAD1W419_PELCU|nr:Hypothetical predicted protein [Pelobates cultripes]